MEWRLIAVLVIALFACSACDTELGHTDHDHDGDGVQDHAPHEHAAGENHDGQEHDEKDHSGEERDEETTS